MATVTFTTRGSLNGNTVENINDVTDCLDKLLNGVNNIDAAQMSAAMSQRTGVSNGTNLADGKCIIATEQSTTSASFTTLATPDQVDNIVLPSDGLIFVMYSALCKETSVNGTLRAAIFVGNNQLQAPQASGAPVTLAARTSAPVNGAYFPVVSAPFGLACVAPADGVTNSTNISTGQAIALGQGAGVGFEANSTPITGPAGAGGHCSIWAAAGTYTISVRFRCAGGGAAYAKERKLWVWTKSFG